MQDLEQRRKLELDAIVGSVIELAERASIAVPTIRHVNALTQARVRALGISGAPRLRRTSSSVASNRGEPGFGHLIAHSQMIRVRQLQMPHQISWTRLCRFPGTGA